MTDSQRSIWIRRGLFTTGCIVALLFSARQIAWVVPKYALIPQIVASQTTVLDYQCRDEDCVRCLSGLKATSGAFVMTGGSSFRTGLDVDALASTVPEPLVDCMRNDSRADTYRLFFDAVPATERNDIIFHGYNSWALNSPGTWRDAAAQSFFTSTAAFKPSAPPTRWDVVKQYLLYANIFLVRQLTESPMEWRTSLKVRLPGYAAARAEYWPLTRPEHFRRRLNLMKRWFALSPYARSFAIQMDRMRPAEEIISRHEAFLRTMAPADRFVFVPAPELSDVFPDRMREVIAQSRTVALGFLSSRPGVRLVDVDYAACGLVPEDFWSETHMLFDVAHSAPSGRPKITKCVIDAMTRANIDAALRPH
jgi:hypothetical protein